MNRPVACVVLAAWAWGAAAWGAAEGPGIEAAQQSYDRGNYTQAVTELRAVVARDQQNGPALLLLTKSLLELQQHDAAVNSAEKAVAVNSQSSEYHEWLGRAYGEKADHSSWFSAVPLAKKARREFEQAVELDSKNFIAYQDLIEFDCTAPGLVGGGEEKGRTEIAKLAELDKAQGHYAAGTCDKAKKNFAGADAEFTLALQSEPKSVRLIYDIGDYAAKHSQAERLLAVADAGEKLQASDARGKFYRAAGLILKKEHLEQAEQLLRAYLKEGVPRSDAPRPASAHAWLGKLYEEQGKNDAALEEYRSALKLDPKNKNAQDAMKHLQKN